MDVFDEINFVISDVTDNILQLRSYHTGQYCISGPVLFVLQLQLQTQSECCCLLLVSEDNHQLFCQVSTNTHTHAPKVPPP